MNPESDFYIGYLPKAPTRLGRFVRRAIVGLGLLAGILAVVLSLGQMRFASSYFEFGKLRTFEGTVVARPYPSLIVTRPGQADQGDGTSEYLLVAPGKHGADALTQSFREKSVRLRGQLIYRNEKTMVEIEPGSIRQEETHPAQQPVPESLGTLTVTGEIVDSKCYLGVMNPGNGKVHRDCASRCLSGGIPPLFIEFASGKTFLLVGIDTGALSYKDISEFVAEPLTVTGEHILRGDQHLLSINPRKLKHSD